MQTHRALLRVAAVVFCLSHGAFVPPTAFAQATPGNQSNVGSHTINPETSTMAGSPGPPTGQSKAGSPRMPGLSSRGFHIYYPNGQSNAGSPGRPQ
jgi:hypothetical protein